MIPVEQKRDVFSSGAEGTASFEISGKDAAHIMTILRDTLYSDKVLAVLREYASNAWDANRMAGRGDRPIDVTLPTYADPTLRIRDYGPGLSKADVFEVYNKYGASTKRDSNTAVGMLGIGSKSGFAYSDSFTIMSWHGGKRSTYIAVIDDSEKGRVDLMDVSCQRCGFSHSDEKVFEDHLLLRCNSEGDAETGVEIQIAVKPHDINEFSSRAISLFSYFEPRPNINITLPDMPSGWKCDGYGIVMENTGWKGSGTWTAVMGCVPYRINLNQLSNLSSSARNLSGVLWFDIGELQVAASREELKYGDSTKDALSEKINGIIDKYVEHLLAGVDDLSQWERRLRVRQINDLYLPVPSMLKGLSDSYISFDSAVQFKLRRKSTYRKGKIEGTRTIPVKSTTRLVFRNEKRNMQGYEFKEDDVIVDVAFDEQTARKALKEQITKHRIDGISIVNISTLPWTKPATGPRSQIDSARAKASCLVLSPNNINADRKSERWAVASRVAKDDDVYVILDSYMVNGFSDFYDTFLSDQELLTQVGGTMPQIIGYRNTQARPVDRSKLKGVDYRVWRDDGYVKLLLAQSGVKEALASKVWASVISYGVFDDHITEVGSDTPLGKFMQKSVKGAKEYRNIDYKMQQSVGRVFHSLKENEVNDEWDKLTERYPLLKTFGRPDIAAFAGEHRKHWIEYINMVDEVIKSIDNGNEEEEEIAA